MRVRYEIFAASPLDGLPAELMRSDEFLAKPMSVEEAIMQMDLMNNEFLVFTRPESRDVSVVYRRKDGNYGVIDSGSSLAAVSGARGARVPTPPPVPPEPRTAAK